MAYDKTTDRITLPIEDLFDLLRSSAEEGIRVGKANTVGDHTASGIAFNVFREFMRNSPRPPQGTVYRSTEQRENTE